MNTSIYINSEDRQQGTSDDFYATIGPKITNPSKYSKMMISDCMFRNTLYTINSTNNKLWFSFRAYMANTQLPVDYPFAITITPGTYNETTLAGLITTATILSSLTATYSWQTSGPTLACTWNANTLKFTITVSGTNWVGAANALVATFPAGGPASSYYKSVILCDKTFTNFTWENSLNSIMGWDNTYLTYPSYAAYSTLNMSASFIFVAPNACDINEWYRFIYLCCDYMQTDNMTSISSNQGAIKSVIGKIPLTSYGTTTYWESPSFPLTVMPVDLSHTNYMNMHIYFRDRKMNPLTFNGTDNQITIKLLE